MDNRLSPFYTIFINIFYCISVNLELEESLDPCDCPQECDVIKFDQIISTLANKYVNNHNWKGY